MCLIVQIIIKKFGKKYLQTGKMGRFLEGVKLKALGRQEAFELVEKRKNILGMERHEQKPKVESGILGTREQYNIALARMEIESSKRYNFTSQVELGYRELKIQAEEFKFNVL